METIFIKLIDMSVTASWLVLIVLVLRFVLKKAPRWIHCCLWAMVAVRLLCPVSFESDLSLVPERSPVTEQSFARFEAATTADTALEYAAQEKISIPETRPQTEATTKTAPYQRETSSLSSTEVLALVWLLGVAVMITYAFVSYCRLEKRVAPSIALVDNLFLCDYIESPFILGIVRPRIYLPSAMDPNAAAHVLAHERAHIQRKDHWWKPLGFFLLTLHWFNPILWLAYVLLCRDIELACDEKVIRRMDAADKRSYSEALLSCSVPRHMIAACPLAFGEVGVKERVKTVLKYKKPTFWIILIAVLALIVTAVCFLTDPKTISDDPIDETDGTYQTDPETRFDDPYAPADTPYQWTSNLTVEDVIPTLVVLDEETSYTYTPTDQQLNTVINALNQVPEADIQIVNRDDVEWKYLGVQVVLCNEELQHIYLTLTDYGVMFETGSGAEDLYPGLSPEENWFIRSEALEQALRDLSYGGTYMLSDQNRQAVKNALETYYVRFFDPQVYGDLLFVGCIYGDDQTGLAVFAEDGNGGYTLQRVTQYEYLTVCPDTSNVWLDRYIADGMNLYVFVNRNDILRQIQWIGEFEATVSAGDDPNLIIVDVPEDAKTEYRFTYGRTGVTEYTDITAGKPFVASAEYAYQYADMKLSFFEGWEYEIVEYADEYTPFGIRFRPEGEEGWIFLQFSPNGFGVCGTGLKTVSGGMSNGYMTEHGYYDGKDIWTFIRIIDMPGSYTVVNEGADSWIPEYEADLQTILENMVVAEDCLDIGHIQRMALWYAEEQGWHESADGSDEAIIYESRFNYEKGIWYVTLRKAGSTPFEVQINVHGVVQNEE